MRTRHHKYETVVKSSSNQVPETEQVETLKIEKITKKSKSIQLTNVTNTITSQSTKTKYNQKKIEEKVKILSEIKRSNDNIMPSTSQSSTKENKNESSELRFFRVLKDVLGQHYVNVKNRLKLDFQPNCVLNMEHCSQNHTKNTKFNVNEIDHFLVSDARHTLKEDKPLEFLKLISNLSLSNHFPGHDVLLAVLELILTINNPCHQSYKTSEVIRTCCFLFDQVLCNFPPCWQQLQGFYRQMIKRPLRIGLPKNDYNVQDGIFRITLTMLESVLEENEESIEKLTDSMSDSQLDIDFRSYELKSLQKFEFHQLTRDEKIERVFLVLHLIIKLMESDLALWIVRHPVNINLIMSTKEKMPLIAFILWDDPENCGEINTLIKQIFRIFIVCIQISMPEDKVNILARLVNLICVAVNLCEMQKNSLEVEFPIIKSQTQALAAEIIKKINDISSTNVDLFLAVIDNIQNSNIRLIVIDSLLSKLNPHSTQMSIRKIYENMKLKQWMECDTEGSRIRFEFVPYSALTTSKYPVYETNPRAKKSKYSNEIYRKDYLALMLNFFETYLDVYRIDEFLRQLNRKHNEENQTNNDRKTKRLSEYENKYFNYERMAVDIKMLQLKFLKEKAAKSRISYGKSDQIFNDVLVNGEIALKYRNDLKYFVALGELLKAYRAEYGDLFEGWLKYYQ